MEIIPKTLATNCGMDVVRTITELRAKHAERGHSTFGIDGNSKKISDMTIQNIWEPISVKFQVIKTAIEASCLLLRIDDVVSGVKKREKEKSGQPMQGEEPMETFGDARDGWSKIYVLYISSSTPFLFFFIDFMVFIKKIL